MSNIQVITGKQDEADRSALVEALGTENNSIQWLVFMDTVSKLLAVVLKVGRTKQNVVEQSLIGRLGFTSWRQMIETEQERGGLGWNWSAWVAWRRAYKVVQANPYLRDLRFTSNKVNTLEQQAKAQKKSFPKTMEEFHDWQRRLKTSEEGRLKDEVKRWKREATMWQEGCKRWKETGDAMEAQIEGMVKAVEMLEKSYKAEQEENQRLRAIKEPAPLTRWQHLKKAIFG